MLSPFIDELKKIECEDELIVTFKNEEYVLRETLAAFCDVAS